MYRARYGSRSLHVLSGHATLPTSPSVRQPGSSPNLILLGSKEASLHWHDWLNHQPLGSDSTSLSLPQRSGKWDWNFQPSNHLVGSPGNQSSFLGGIQKPPLSYSKRHLCCSHHRKFQGFWEFCDRKGNKDQIYISCYKSHITLSTGDNPAGHGIHVLSPAWKNSVLPFRSSILLPPYWLWGKSLPWKPRTLCVGGQSCLLLIWVISALFPPCFPCKTHSIFFSVLRTKLWTQATVFCLTKFPRQEN